MEKLVELEQRLDEYRQHCIRAEKAALKKLSDYPKEDVLSPAEVLRRELLRHHTRILLVDEMKRWIGELKGMRLYQLYALPDATHEEKKLGAVQQHMTEQEAAEVNATYEANRERLRWKPVDRYDTDMND